MDKKSNSFLLILALCVVIIIAVVLWLMQGKEDAGTDEMLRQLQQTQDDGGEADLNQLQNEALDL